MAATWFARLGVNARVIDKRSTKIFTGQADGLQVSLLLLIFSPFPYRFTCGARRANFGQAPRAGSLSSFGFGDRVVKEAVPGFGAWVCPSFSQVSELRNSILRGLLLRTRREWHNTSCRY